LGPTISRLYAGLLEVLGRERLESGDLDAAVRAFGQLRDMDPRSAAADEGLVLAFMRQGRPDLARRELRRVVARGSGVTQALNALGVIALQEGAVDSAETYFRRALEADPRAPLAHYNLGMLLAEDPRRAEEAARHLSEFVTLAPDDPGVAHAREALSRLPVARGASRRAP
jgi:Flp pilus assembly protein TadD